MRRLALVLFLSSLAAAQNSAWVAFRDSSGYRADISKDAVNVKQDGSSVRVLGLEQPDRPRMIALLIDSTGSARRHDKEEREVMREAVAWLEKTLRPADRVAVVNFNDEQYLDAKLTDSLEA